MVNKKSLIGKFFLPVYNCLGTAGVLLLLLSFLPNHWSADFHFHDSYFVISSNIIKQWLSYFLLLLWAIYFLMQAFFIFTGTYQLSYNNYVGFYWIFDFFNQ